MTAPVPSSAPPAGAAPGRGSHPSTRGSHFKPRGELLLVCALCVAAIAFWQSIFLFPVKLFVVLLHELSHGAAAVATGGAIDHIEIDERLGGVCYTRGGIPAIVVSSGYIGSMILGAAILLAARRRGIARALGYGIGAAVPILTVLYVRTTFGILFGLGFGATLLVATRALPPAALRVALQALGAISCLYALVDLREDVLTFETRTTDAEILARMTGVPAIVWGVLWSAVALAVAFAVGRALLRGGGKGRTVNREP